MLVNLPTVCTSMSIDGWLIFQLVLTNVTLSPSVKNYSTQFSQYLPLLDLNSKWLELTLTHKKYCGKKKKVPHRRKLRLISRRDRRAPAVGKGIKEDSF